MAVAIVGAVVAIGSALFGASQQKAAAKGQLQIARANREAQEVVRKAKNEYEGAATALANYIRSANNNQLLKAAGKNYNAIGQNVARVYDQAERGKLTQRIAAAETLGTIAAAAAASGVGGTTVEMINSTFERVDSIQRQARDEQLDLQAYDMYQARSNVMANAVAQMDQGQTNANIDNNVAITPYVAMPSMLGAAVQGIGNAMPYISQAMQNWSARSQASAAAGANTAATSTAPAAGANLRF